MLRRNSPRRACFPPRWTLTPRSDSPGSPRRTLSLFHNLLDKLDDLPPALIESVASRSRGRVVLPHLAPDDLILPDQISGFRQAVQDGIHGAGTQAVPVTPQLLDER